jgi:DnaJ-class molecular chaperone
MRSLLREPGPADDDDEPDEKTPPLPQRRTQRCRVCRGTGRVHLIQRGREDARGRRCPACRGTGFVDSGDDQA